VATVVAYLADFARGDAAGMAALVVPASAGGLVAAVDEERTGLRVSAATYLPGALVVHGASATVPFTARLQLQGLGTWSFADSLSLQRLAGRWEVVWSPEAVYPGLSAGDTLVRVRTLPTRAPIELADGTPLLGLDGELDANVLGPVIRVNAKEAEVLGAPFEAGDLAGVSGLERAINTQLAGTPTGSVEVVPAGAASGTVVAQFAGHPGTPLRTSIDLTVQQAAEAALAGLGSFPGALVAIDVRTGAVLALANHPYGGYPNATIGTYPPGSTFKMVTATAAIMSGFSPSSMLDCTPSVIIDGRAFQNAAGESFGPITLARAFAVSCNTAFVRLEGMLPAGAEAAAGRLYGISSKLGPGPLPYPSFGGLLPPPVDAVEAAADSIGQGRVLMSPLEMASIAAGIAAGAWREPYLTLPRPAGSATNPLPSAVPPALHQFMADVVAYGTAAASGLPAGTFGKTGTAEYGSHTPPYTYAWFAGFRGNVAFACVAGGGGTNAGYGASTAAPTIARFLDALPAGGVA
ncbi:MAG: penicillin-binding transpeptidase domain-containing protein, partial [Mycobacteriales bacterium]